MNYIENDNRGMKTDPVLDEGDKTAKEDLMSSGYTVSHPFCNNIKTKTEKKLK